jgi:hypothetical protein
LYTTCAERAQFICDLAIKLGGRHKPQHAARPWCPWLAIISAAKSAEVLPLLVLTDAVFTCAEIGLKNVAVVVRRHTQMGGQLT